MPEVQSWVQYRALLIKTLENIDRDLVDMGKKIESLDRQIVALQIEFNMQKMRIGFLGAAAGSVPMLVVAAIWWLTRGK